ncbi:MAG: hypothetical protein EOP48_23535 [Sphingobacteriales bacterium]|nr:MAG: hypothetical protein EOP48_23535 [Sphingobacteriales bacterium]
MNQVRKIEANQSPYDIVRSNYKTADILSRYNINYCCGAKIPVTDICETMGIDVTKLVHELNMAVNTMPSITLINTGTWTLHFLVDYTINIHHVYLRQNLPVVMSYLDRFKANHGESFKYVDQLIDNIKKLTSQLFTHMDEEESIIFPYIKQIHSAHLHKENYAGLLVRTLKKPVDNLSRTQQHGLNATLLECRNLTNSYTVTEKSCLHHKVTFAKLRELDDNLTQHLYLENEIIFPRAISIERELLENS